MPNNTISKKQVLAPAIAAVLVAMASTTLMSGAAYAQEGLHLVGDVSTDVSGNTLTVSGEVAGAGRTATATLTGSAIVTQGCITPSGSNEPRGLVETTEDINVSDTFNTRQGRGTFDLEFTATGDSDFECPSANMRETVVDVEFTDLTLTITSQTGSITEELPDQ
ncbi:MAG TPA: hypothetical protein VKA40_07740 [Nitrososphaera sp.]|jgi:hypothetical protein|nr:hypothetical protein [Nitrososphaera sp.]